MILDTSPLYYVVGPLLDRHPLLWEEYISTLGSPWCLGYGYFSAISDIDNAIAILWRYTEKDASIVLSGS